MAIISTHGGTMEKELYLLLGTVLGALVTLCGTIVTTRSQRKLAQESHEHQYRIETQKLEYQQRKENIEFVREKLEDVHRILSKIGMENSLTGSYITREIGITKEQYHAQYLKNDEEVCRLLMIADLYFPQLQGTAHELRGLMNLFWGQHQNLIAQEAKVSENEYLNNDVIHRLTGEIIGIGEKIAAQVGNAKYKLEEIAASLRDEV
jgi:hypothetical protein